MLSILSLTSVSPEVVQPRDTVSILLHNSRLALFLSIYDRATTNYSTLNSSSATVQYLQQSHRDFQMWMRDNRPT